MKILLAQFRDDKVTRDHEYDCFLQQGDLDVAQVDRVNMLQDDVSPDRLKQYDALITGGSGEYLISDGDIPDRVAAMGRVMQAARDKQMPSLGVCFGAQIMTHVFGGRLEKDIERAEMGTYTITKNQDAADCPILSDLPDSFDAQLGHKDHVMALPKGAINLASSERSEVQAFTFPGERTYGFTFHPELDEDAMHFRFNYYADQYGMTEEKLKQFKEMVWDTPYAKSTLQRFIDEVAKAERFYPRKVS